MGDGDKNLTTQQLFERVKISNVMSKPVTINFKDTLSNAKLKFNNHNISHLIVVDDGGKLEGILSPKYLYKAQSPRKIITKDMGYARDIISDGDSFYMKETLDSYLLSNIMYKNPYTLGPDD